MRLAPVLLLACGPSILWTGHTGDRRAHLELVAAHGAQHLDVDGRPGHAYRAIAATSIVSDGPHVAFAAQAGDRWVVDVDGTAGPAFDGIGDIAIAPTGHVAYAAETAGGWRVVVDGAAGARFDAILAGTLRFDGARAVYAGRTGTATRVIAGARVDEGFDGIGWLVVDGAHDAYAGRRGDAMVVVADGAPGPAWTAVRDVALASGRVAYAAWDGTHWRVVAGGEPGPSLDAVAWLAWRGDGAHLAWVGRLDDRDVLALDDAPVATAAHLAADKVAFRPAAGGAEAALAYAIADGSGERVVVTPSRDPEPAFDEVGAPAWSDTGRLAYAARRGPAWLVVVDGTATPAGTHAGRPVWGPRDRLGYVARRDRAAHVVVDGTDHRFDLAFEDSLVFSRDGAHWAVVAGDLATERLFVAIDGATRVPIAADELYAAHPRADLLQAWARAELER